MTLCIAKGEAFALGVEWNRYGNGVLARCRAQDAVGVTRYGAAVALFCGSQEMACNSIIGLGKIILTSAWELRLIWNPGTAMVSVQGFVLYIAVHGSVHTWGFTVQHRICDYVFSVQQCNRTMSRVSVTQRAESLDTSASLSPQSLPP